MPETTTPPHGEFDAKARIAEAVAKHRLRDGAGTAGSGALRQDAPIGRSPRPEPAGGSAANEPSQALLAFGVVYPGAVILLEAVTGLCRRELFDPIPSLWHFALLAAVPLGNLALWRTLSGKLRLRREVQALVLGFAAGVAGFYSVMFLPLLPLALVAILVGIGVLPFAPVAAMLASLRLGRHLKAVTEATPWSPKHVAAGVAAALLALVALELPFLITRHGMKLAASADAHERARGVELLRDWGSRDMLLDHALGRVSRAAGPLGLVFAVSNHGLLDRPRPILDMQEAREIHYRVTGKSLAEAAAGHARPSTRIWDRDLGGTEVGSTVPGLGLASSRIDGSINADDALAYIEWLFEVKNDGPAASEARMAIALPPGAVVSRVTLWVNGVEEEAAFAGRTQVRQAYERVVRRSQDPFLVTTTGADRILAQAFPVPANGGVMKFKIGITAPLELDSATQGRLVLPAIVDRNFASGDGIRHAIWLESKRSLATRSRELSISPLPGGGSRLAGEIGTRTLAEARPVIAVARAGAPSRVAARNPETGSAVQEIADRPTVPTGTLSLVIDGSAGTKAHVRPILAALDALPAGVKVGVVIAGERSRTLSAAAWGPEHRARVREALLSEAYTGGVDNTEALIAAMLAAGSDPGARVVWIHAPQPVRFAASKTRFAQFADRFADPPMLHLYALAPGPNAILADVPWAGASRDIPATGDITADLGGAFRRMTGKISLPVIQRTLVTGPGLEAEPHMPPVEGTSVTGSSHIVRLAALDEIHRLLRHGRPEARASAIELAALHRLVTPVSGAVVLESKRQYAEAGLVQGMKGEPGKVPTVPEPHEWALMLLAALGLAGLTWRRGRSAAASGSAI